MPKLASLEIKTFLKDGKFIRNQNMIREAMTAFELAGKEFMIIFQAAKKPRSNDQNAFYWGVIIPIVRNCLFEAGHVLTAEQTHDMLRLKFLKVLIQVNEETGEVIERIRSTTELSTVEMMDYLAMIREWVLDFFGVMIPEPDDQMKMKF